MRPDDLVRVGRQRRVGVLLAWLPNKTRAKVRTVCTLDGDMVTIEAVYAKKDIHALEDGPVVWACAGCKMTDNRSLKNARYCKACARRQPIGEAP